MAAKNNHIQTVRQIGIVEFNGVAVSEKYCLPKMDDTE